MAHKAKIIYLLADVHLMPDSQHPINQKFFSFLNNQAQKAQEIYFLGDLFETWTGDDIGLEDYATEIAELKKLTEKGIKTYLCYGNRDFLMHQDFWQATGIEKLEDITYKNLLGHNCILMHGDQLCTLDTGYQKMRKIFRNKLIQNIFLALPKSIRKNIAEKLRNKKTTPLPTQKDINPKYDVNPAEVEKLFITPLPADLSCTKPINLIHGHTHLPNRKILNNNHRWTVSDWDSTPQIIQITTEEIKLIKI